MAQTRIINAARQRYKMVPVLDDDGKQKEVAVTNKDGSPKIKRNGNPVTRRLTEADKDQPLPLRKCEKCQADLEIGKPFKVVSIKTQGGGYDRFRCMNEANWAPWEVSNSLSARVMQIQSEDIDVSSAESEEDVQAEADRIKEMIEELAAEKREAQENMESGFGHATYQSDEIGEQADNLDSWASEFDSISFEDAPDEFCHECDGEGDGAECPNCNNTHKPTGYDDELEEWRENCRQAIQDALDNCPI